MYLLKYGSAKLSVVCLRSEECTQKNVIELTMDQDHEIISRNVLLIFEIIYKI